MRKLYNIRNENEKSMETNKTIKENIRNNVFLYSKCLVREIISKQVTKSKRDWNIKGDIFDKKLK